MLLGTKADFSQRDPRWAGKKLGFAKWQTLGGYGCLITAYANVAQAMGKDATPLSINEAFKKKNMFVIDDVGEKSDVRSFDALCAVYPDIKYVETINWGSKLADIKYFDVRATTKKEIILMMDMRPYKAGVQTHFCRVIGTNAAKNDVEIVDSWDGKRKWISSYGKPANKLIYKAFKFVRP